MQHAIDDLTSSKSLKEGQAKFAERMSQYDPSSLRYANSPAQQAAYTAYQESAHAMQTVIRDAERTAEKADAADPNTPYKPQGRTDESSYDYTDHPANLADTFGASKLQQAIDDAGKGATHATLKFDYEENVPIKAVREALGIAKSSRSRW